MNTTQSVTQTTHPALNVEAKATAVRAVAKVRLSYIDTLRLAMIVLVILMHTAVTYSGMGGWYYKENSEVDLVSTLLFALGQASTQAYFMGLLFLLAGYFVPGAYDKKGFGKFMKDRLVRLGIPTLLYMLVIHPFTIYTIMGLPWANPKPGFLAFYTDYITSFDFVGESGPLWFALALLIFTFFYALVRLSVRQILRQKEMKVTNTHAFLLIGLITVAAFAIRLVQPLGTDVLNMQLGYFASYIILFITGILAYRYDLLNKIDTRFGMRWLLAAMVAGPVLFLTVLFAGGAPDNGLDAFNGGWHWQAAAYALWESFTAVAMSIGLLVLFREKFNRQNRFMKVLSDNSFAAYVFHAPVLISISLLLQPLALYPLAKFFLVGALAIIAVFALTHFVLRRIPLLKQVI